MGICFRGTNHIRRIQLGVLHARGDVVCEPAHGRSCHPLPSVDGCAIPSIVSPGERACVDAVCVCVAGLCVWDLGLAWGRSLIECT